MTWHFNYHPHWHLGNNQSAGSSAPVVSRWLWPGNRTFLEVISWWIVAFLCCDYTLQGSNFTQFCCHRKYRLTILKVKVHSLKSDIYTLSTDHYIGLYCILYIIYYWIHVTSPEHSHLPLENSAHHKTIVLFTHKCPHKCPGETGSL